MFEKKGKTLVIAGIFLKKSHVGIRKAHDIWQNPYSLTGSTTTRVRGKENERKEKTFPALGVWERSGRPTEHLPTTTDFSSKNLFVPLQEIETVSPLPVLSTFGTRSCLYVAPSKAGMLFPPPTFPLTHRI